MSWSWFLVFFIHPSWKGAIQKELYLIICFLLNCFVFKEPFNDGNCVISKYHAFPLEINHSVFSRAEEILFCKASVVATFAGWVHVLKNVKELSPRSDHSESSVCSYVHLIDWLLRFYTNILLVLFILFFLLVIKSHFFCRDIYIIGFPWVNQGIQVVSHL